MIRMNEKYEIGEHFIEGRWKGGHVARAFRSALRNSGWDETWFTTQIEKLVEEIKAAGDGTNFFWTEEFQEFYDDSGVEINFDLTKQGDEVEGWIYAHWYIRRERGEGSST